MSDNGAPQGQESGGSTTQQGQEPAGQQGQQGQESGAPQGDQQQQSQTPDLSAITDPNLRAWVEAQTKDAAEARRQAATYRTERNTYQQQVQEFQRKNETAEQQAQREQAERDAQFQQLQDENRALKVGQAFASAATSAHALDAGGLLNLIGGPGKVELDEQGAPKNIEALITQAREQYPWAFSRTSADAGGGSERQPAGTGNMNDFIRGRR